MWLTNLFHRLFNTYSVLTHDEIQVLIKKGYITADPSRVNATSVDVTLHDQLKEEAVAPSSMRINLMKKEAPIFVPMLATSVIGGYQLRPQGFVLGATEEMFNLPDDITAVFYMKSSLARSGLDHCNAGFIDPGFNGSRLTLELKNVLTYNTLVLDTGMPIGQIKFYRHRKVPADKSYRVTGQYNGDDKVQESKGAR